MTNLPQYARRRRHVKWAGSYSPCRRLGNVVVVVLLVVAAKVLWGSGGGIVHRGGERGAWFTAGREDVLVRMEGDGKQGLRPEVKDYNGMESDYDDVGDESALGDTYSVAHEALDETVSVDGQRNGNVRALPQRTRALPTSSPPPSPTPRPSPPRAKHQYGPCKIHVLDPTPSSCNITDVWPFDHPGRGMGGMSRTPHQFAPHAAGYWLVHAVKSTPGYYESDMEKADLVLVDTHCFESQYLAVTGGAGSDGVGAVRISEREQEQVSLAISRVFVDAVTNTNAFVKSKGKKFVVVRPTLGAPPGSMLDTCAKLKSVFFVGSERGIFCDNDRERAWKGESVLLPPVSVGYEMDVELTDLRAFEDRDVLMYLRLPCYRHLSRSPNSIFLDSVEDRLLKSWDVLRESFNASESSKVVIEMPEDRCGDGVAVDHSAGVASRRQSLDLMGRSKYCAVFAPGDRQSSVELGLAVRRGCIPVFLGPPFHAMPMAANSARGAKDELLGIEYAKFALFLHVVDHTKSMWAFDDLSLSDGDLEPDADILKSPVEVPDIIDAIRYVQHVPSTVAQGLHAGVLDVRDMFAYGDGDKGGNRDGVRGPVDVALDSMCSYWTKMKMEEARKRQERQEKERQEKERQEKERQA